MLLDLKFNFP